MYEHNLIYPGRYIFICLLVVLSACGPSSPGEKAKSPIEKFDSCMVEGVHRYKVYLPSISADCNELPLLLIIDPHADASNALSKFKAGAEKYKYVLVASASLKNNYPDFAHAINLLLDDVRSKYPVGQSFYIAGLSGGARMALNYSQYMPVNGIISCGALASQAQIEAIKNPIIAIAGMADFNFIEIAQYIFKPDAMPLNLRLEVSEDTHGWPSAKILSYAMGYFQSLEKMGSSCMNNNRLRNRFASEQKHRIDSLQLAGDILNAELIAKNLSVTKGITNYKDFIQIKNSIESSAEFQAVLDQLKESIRFELAVRNAYNSALQSKDTVWWANEIASLNSKMKEDKDYFRALAYQRIKGFIGIMCYTLCSNSLRLEDLDNAARLLSIYRLIEPGNSDMLYFTALYFQKTNKPDLALRYLINAVNAGYSDRERIIKDFSERISLDVLSHINPEP
jgi:hypothetical protein